MKNTSKILINVFVFSLFVMLSTTRSFAQSEKVCVCHNVNNNPVELCADDDSFKVGHQSHIDSGFDTLGACPVANPTPTNGLPTPTSIIQPTGVDVTPEVPEFGVLSGMATIAISTGSYFMLKRKA